MSKETQEQADVYICDECNREGVMCSLRIVNSVPTYCPVSGEELDAGEWCKKQQPKQAGQVAELVKTCESCFWVPPGPGCGLCRNSGLWIESPRHIEQRLQVTIDTLTAQLAELRHYKRISDCAGFPEKGMFAVGEELIQRDAQLAQKETALTDCRIIKDRAEHLREEAEQQLATAQEYARHDKGCHKEYDETRKCTCGFEQDKKGGG